jgi:hypothetical protein
MKSITSTAILVPAAMRVGTLTSVLLVTQDVGRQGGVAA